MTDQELLEFLDSKFSSVGHEDVEKWKQGWVDLARYLDELPESQHHVVFVAARHLSKDFPPKVVPPNEILRFYEIMKKFARLSIPGSFLLKGIRSGLSIDEIISQRKSEGYDGSETARTLRQRSRYY